MKVRTPSLPALTALLLLSLLAFSPMLMGQEAVAQEVAGQAAAVKNPFVGTGWAILPPVIAIGLALITKEVYSSLFIGIFVGGLLGSNFNLVKTFDSVVNQGLLTAVSDGAGIFVFLVMLGVMAALINQTGAAAAFGKWAHKNVKSRTGACLTTFFLGVLIFIDDYFNCLTVGSVMRPITDANRVSRAKLAYLIDATAAPVCMIAPISSWAAAVASFTKGTGLNGQELFLRAIPYNFYSLLTFVFILGIILLKLDFGPMARHERNAREKGDLFTEGEEVDNDMKVPENAKGRIVDLVLPILVLIVASVLALLYVGGYWGEASFSDAFADTDATVGLPLGGLVAMLFSILYLLGRRVISAKEAMKCVPVGFNAMVPAILILVLATSLKNMTGALELKEFIAGLMEGNAAKLGHFLPAVIFLVACFLSFSTGTSWGTFGILIPIVVNIFAPGSTLMYIGMSACLAGAVCGDHCSPISDTTIMSSAGARCQHINHVSTQLPYSVSVAVVSFLGFLLAGLVQNWYVAFPVSVALLIAMLLGMKAFKKA